MVAANIHFMLFFIAFGFSIPCLEAHSLPEMDEYMTNLAEKAKIHAAEAYHPDPTEVTQELNALVHMALEGNNSSRRYLKKYKGPCMATNPIDRCWRCQPNWANDRKRLAKCVLGFGRKTTGGVNGRFYVVTDPSDNDVVNPKPGTLRHAVIQKEPLWIIFAKSMLIKLEKELLVQSDKTIDGRGVNVQIAFGAGLSMQFVRNIIVHGLRIRNIVATEGGMIRDSVDHFGIRTASDGDAISIFGSSNIWIDHVSMSNCADGLVDAIQGSTGVTISNCHMTHHNDVMLFGASDGYDGDKIMQITVAFNHFGQGLVQRMPRARWGFVHVVNNDYTHWLMYAIGGSSNPTIISQGNRFIAPNNNAAKEIAHRSYAPESVWKNWIWKSEKDLLLNGATFTQSGGQLGNKYSKLDMITAKDGTSVTRLTRFSGPLNCVVGKPC